VTTESIVITNTRQAVKKDSAAIIMTHWDFFCNTVAPLVLNVYSAIAWDSVRPGDGVSDFVEDDVCMHPSCTGLLVLMNVGSSTRDKDDPLMRVNFP
jgi:hypothetical protein